MKCFSFFASPSVLCLYEAILSLHLGLLCVVSQDAQHRCILTFPPGAQTEQQLAETNGVRKGCKWRKRKHSFQSQAVSGVTLQPKCDLLGHWGDTSPPRLVTELIKSPNTMPFWAIDAVSFEIFKCTK